MATQTAHKQVHNQYVCDPAPAKIPLWAWHLHHWMENGKKGARPANAPLHRDLPLWFFTWHDELIGQAQKEHAKHVKAYKAKQKTVKPRKKGTMHPDRAKVVHHAMWGSAAKVSPVIHYTEDARRDDWLINKQPLALPMYTDCSGWATQCYFVAGVLDPNGLAYKWLGWTGTELENAEKHGKVFTDLRLALPADIIVMGEGSGEHEVVVVKADPINGNPLVSTHGAEGVQIQPVNIDSRSKRVCQTLPA